MSPWNEEIIMLVDPGSNLLKELKVERGVVTHALGNRGRRITTSSIQSI